MGELRRWYVLFIKTIMYLLTLSANEKKRLCWTTITTIFFIKKTAVSVSNKEKYFKKQTSRRVNGQNITGTQYPFFFYRKRSCSVLLKKAKTNQTTASSFFAWKGKKAVYSILKCILVNKNTLKSIKSTAFLLYPFKKSKLETAFFLK